MINITYFILIFVALMKFQKLLKPKDVVCYVELHERPTWTMTTFALIEIVKAYKFCL